MAVIVKRKGRSPEEVFTYAASTIQSFLKEELEYTTDQTVKVVKGITPVHNPAKYPAWNTRYTRQPHGLLKASVKRKDVRATKHTLRTGIYSNKKYSSYVEFGFTHNHSHRWIRGRFYIGVPMKVVHKRMFPRRVVVALKKSFKEV